jgi:Uma2 family endonuclease
MAMPVTVPTYTLDDLERFPDDGSRYELLEGALLVTPAPRAVHQIVASNIQMQLAMALAPGRHAHVVGPGAITVPPRTQLQPDVLVYPARFSPAMDWASITEHWLAVEVLSRSSRVYDREVKRDAYFALGVGQVWLADYHDQSVEVWQARGRHTVVRDVIRWRVPTLDLVVPVNLATVFADID